MSALRSKLASSGRLVPALADQRGAIEVDAADQLELELLLSSEKEAIN